jgi:elongation factor G
LDKDAIIGTNPDTEKPESRKPSVKEPFAALAFKIATDPFVGRLAFFRAYSGSIGCGILCFEQLVQGTKNVFPEFTKCMPISKMQWSILKLGILVQLLGLRILRQGIPCLMRNIQLFLESMNFPDPVIGIAVEPKTKADVDKLGMALAKLAEEDPTFQVKTDEASGQTIISGMGELHLDIIVDRLRREFKVECKSR